MGIRDWMSSLVGSAGDPQKQAGAGAPPPAAQPPGKGPNLQQVDVVARDARSVGITVELKRKAGTPIQVTVHAAGGWVRTVTFVDGSANYRNGRSFSDALVALAQRIGSDGVLEIASIKASSSSSPVSGKALLALGTAALYEAMGRTPPSAEELDAEQRAARAAVRGRQTESKGRRKKLLALLGGGAEGVAEWNRRRDEALELTPFKKVDLAGKDLAGASLVDMPEGRFAGAILAGADLRGVDLRSADFQSATLTEARADKADLRRAKLGGANLEGASLAFAKLQGATLTGARLAGVQWRGVLYDEATVWPEGFELPEVLMWTGKGPSPSALAAIDSRKKAEGPVDLKMLMQRIEQTIEKGRLGKALSMLKKDSFQLFVDVQEASLAGVVKSQNDPELVYSCTLAASGAYSCCTQNLNVCGGLRGAICKHLLVLVVGLAQAGQIEPDTLDDWVQRSTLHQPQLDRDAASAILIRYKGAEAGEIDWRPTETLPEDFYAY